MDRRLSDAIKRDNEQEDAGMHADDRETCWTHQTWAEECANCPVHIDPSTLRFPRPARS